MAIITEPGPELSEQQALAVLAENYPFTTVLDVPAVDNEAHWHQFNAEFYILSGELVLTTADNQHHTCTAGTRVVVPTRIIHAERSAGYRIALGTSVMPEEFGDPVDRPVSELPGA